MTVVTDTSPICYLVLIGKAELLSKLFRNVLMPQAVVAELLHADAPEPVRAWASRLPPWVCVHENPTGSTAGLEKLQVGEINAILLAELSQPSTVLLDEKAARRIATARGIPVAGTLGLLGEAATRGLVDLTEAIDMLRKTNFRCSPSLLRSTLDRFGPTKL